MLSQFQTGSIGRLSDEIRLGRGTFFEPTPRFNFLVGWSADYDSLFEESFTEKTGIEVVLKKSYDAGRVLLCAKGGGGKTVIMHRLARLALDEGALPVLLDLKRWTARHYSEWKEHLASHSDRAEFLLRSFSLHDITPSRLVALPPQVKRFLLVDGLNEVSSTTGNQIIEALEEFVRYAPQTSLILTDRMSRRQFQDASRWRLGTVLPLEESEIRFQLSKTSEGAARFDRADLQERYVLTSPYFLDSALKDGHSAPSSASMIRQYLAKHASLEDAELDSAALAAYQAYEVAKARTFSFDLFEEGAGKNVTDKLVEARVLIKDADLAFFDHHLRHDYLVSRFLAANPKSTWVPSAFNAVTLFASSFDVLRLTLEQLPDSEQADHFIRRVYDWNLYGAAYCVTEGRQHKSSHVSPEMEVFLLAMLAERKWDIVLSTSRRASDALRLFPNQDARAFLATSSLSSVFDLVDKVETNKGWFSEWRRIFTRQPGSDTTDAELGLVRDPESIMGWTYANVLKRLALSEDQQRLLVSFLAGENETIRWRIAHLLGAFPSTRNADVLLALFDFDSDRWVRFGAIRSLIEAAALTKTATLREHIFAQLNARVDRLYADPICLDQFEHAIFISKENAPKNWWKLVVNVIDALLSNVSSNDELEHFERLAYKLKEYYGV